MLAFMLGLVLHTNHPVHHIAAVAQSKPAIHKRHKLRRVVQKWLSMLVLTTEYVVNPFDPWVCRKNGAEYFSGTRTADGSLPSRGTIAIDTNLFRFGTRFVIPGYGRGVAHDTGGAIIGRHLDLAVNSCAEAIAWGSRRVRVLYSQG